MQKYLIVLPHQGLGDHLLCNGLYRSLAQQATRVIILVKSKNFDVVARMLTDVENITLFRTSNKFEQLTIRVVKFFTRVFGLRRILLGNYGESFYLDGIRFDENFYLQAGVSFENRWDQFFVQRDEFREEELFKRLDCSDGPYIFLHEDKSRAFLVDRNKLPLGIRVVEPLTNQSEFSFFDYRKVLEGAAEIHVIESSFAAYIESLSLVNLKFAHRYARPEASKDFRSEFTYKSKWTIFA